MKILSRPFMATFIVSIITLVVFSLWYKSNNSPLSAQELETLLPRLVALEEPTQGFVNAKKVSEFLSTDDGQPFYVVNVFKFKPKASYFDGRATSLSGAEVLNQYSRAILPTWIKNGTHPVFVTSATSSISNEWDFVSVVRYRSRRDYVSIITSDEFAEAFPHRLAATEDNVRVLLPGNLIPNPIIILMILCSLLILMVYLVEQRKKNNDR